MRIKTPTHISRTLTICATNPIRFYVSAGVSILPPWTSSHTEKSAFPLPLGLGNDSLPSESAEFPQRERPLMQWELEGS